MNKTSALLTLLKLRGPQTVDEFYKKTRQSIPSMRESAQKEYKQLADTILLNDDLYKESKNDSLKNAIKSRIYNLSSKDNLSAYEHSNRISSYKDVMDYIKKKENRPRTRIFSDDELENKYKPFHERRGKKFTEAKLDEYNRKKSLDSIFDEFERYRESSAFKNFKGDSFPKLTKEERSQVLKALISDNNLRRKKTKLYDYITRDHTADFENAITKSKKKLFPDEPFEEAVLSPEQMSILKDFFRKRGKPIYRKPVRVDSQQVQDAINRAEMEKYLNKPQKIIQSDTEYDGTSFEDLMESINND